MTCKFRLCIAILCVCMCVLCSDPNIVIYYYVIWLPSLVNFLVILGSQHPFSFNFYFMLI